MSAKKELPVIRCELSSDNYRATMDKVNQAVAHLKKGGRMVLVDPEATGTAAIARIRFDGYWSQITIEKKP